MFDNIVNCTPSEFIRERSLVLLGQKFVLQERVFPNVSPICFKGKVKLSTFS